MHRYRKKEISCFLIPKWPQGDGVFVENNPWNERALCSSVCFFSKSKVENGKRFFHATSFHFEREAFTLHHHNDSINYQLSTELWMNTCQLTGTDQFNKNTVSSSHPWKHHNRNWDTRVTQPTKTKVVSCWLLCKGNAVQTEGEMWGWNYMSNYSAKYFETRKS